MSLVLVLPAAAQMPDGITIGSNQNIFSALIESLEGLSSLLSQLEDALKKELGNEIEIVAPEENKDEPIQVTDTGGSPVIVTTQSSGNNAEPTLTATAIKENEGGPIPICEGESCGSIHGKKYHDINGNGKIEHIDYGWPVDAGQDPVFEGWTIYLGDAKGGVIDSDITDSNGEYLFNHLADGTYTVWEEVQPGWVLTTATSTYTIDIVEGARLDKIDFANFKPGSITGCKFNDVNFNGAWDKDEPTMAGWTINLDGYLLAQGPGLEVHRTTETNEDGCYRFDDVWFGNYQVSEVDQDGWYQTYPDRSGEPGIHPLNFKWFVWMRSGLEFTNADFGNGREINEPKGSIHGYKWNDENGNGQRDCPPTGASCEPLLGNWPINLYQNDELIRTEYTMNDGEHFGWYWFQGLYAGDYRVCEGPQDGWNQTYPAENGCYNVHLDSADDSFEEGHFGNHEKDCREPVVVDGHTVSCLFVGHEGEGDIEL